MELLIDVQCSGCKAPLKVNRKLDVVECEYCGKVFTIAAQKPSSHINVVGNDNCIAVVGNNTHIKGGIHFK